MFKNTIKESYVSLIISCVNLVLYHLPLFQFVTDNLDYKSWDGILTLASLVVIILVLNALIFYIILFIAPFIGRVLLVLSLNINAIAVYFIFTYGVIIDKTMIGNVLNTNYEESSSFFSFSLILYLILLGVIPSILIFKIKIVKVKIRTFLVHTGSALLFVLIISTLVVGCGLIKIQKP